MKTSTVDLALPAVIGHRGACGYAPENTMASFIKAHEMQVSCVEFDVQLTADHKLVVFHDDNFSRLCQDKIKLESLDYAACSQFDVGSHFGPEHKGQIVPLLEDVLRYCLQVGITPNIEVKPNAVHAVDIAEALVQLLASLWPHDRMPPLVSSFEWDILEILYSMVPTLKFGVLCEALPSNWQNFAESINAFNIIMDHHEIDAAVVTEVHEAGYPLGCYTLNETARAQHLFKLGVDSIVTDYPDRIFAAIT